MLESFSNSLELTAQQKEGIGELIALWVLAIFISTAILVLIRQRNKKQPAEKHSPKQANRLLIRKKNKVTH